MNKDIVLTQEGLLRIKRLYEDILDITIQQKQLLDSEDEQSWPMEKILELQDKRQEIMQQIDELDSAEKFYSERQRSGNTGVGENVQVNNDESVFQATMAQIRKTLLDIQAVELSCQAKMEEAKRKTKDKMSQTRENKKAQIAYNQSNSYEGAWFVDKKR